MEERRREVRHLWRTRVWVRGEAFLGPVWFDTHDLSTGGMFVRSDFLLEQNTPLVLEYGATGQESRRFTASVAWVRETEDEAGERPAGMGLAFTDQTDEDRHFLATLLQAGQERKLA